MGDVRADLERAGHEVRVVSAGSSLTAGTSRPPTASPRSGRAPTSTTTCARWPAGPARPDEIAATMLATVVSTGGSGAGEARVTVDAGSKTLTTTTDPEYGSGHLAGWRDTTFTRLSEEHGVLTVSGLPALTIGQRVRILPVHVCAGPTSSPRSTGCAAAR